MEAKRSFSKTNLGAWVPQETGFGNPRGSSLFAAMKTSTAHRILVRARPQQCCSTFVVSFCSYRNPGNYLSLRQPNLWTVDTFAVIHANFAAHRSHSSLPVSQNSNVPSAPFSLIDFTAAAKIEGDESHVATIVLHPGETLRAESGSMVFMTEGIVSKFIHLTEWIVLWSVHFIFAHT